MRPAEVCVWKRNPFSSRSLIVLRIVAGESPRPKRLAMVRLAAGSAVCTYVSITAPSTTRSRSVSGVVKSSNPFQPNKLRNRRVPGQGGDDAVETQPAGGGATHTPAFGNEPALVDEGGERRGESGNVGQGQPLDGSEPEIDTFELALLVGELLARFERRLTCRDRASVGLPGRTV